MVMTLRTSITGGILFGLAVLLSPAFLRAQARPTVSGPGSYVSVGGGASIYQADYGQRDLGGFMAYGDANLTWRYGLEAEARFLNHHTDEDVTETNYLIGPRVSIFPGYGKNPFRPYVKFLVGAGKIEFPFKFAQGTYFTLAPGAGLDVAIGSRLTVRVIDVEYQDWTNFTYGGMHPYGISAGISFRLNGAFRPARTGRW